MTAGAYVQRSDERMKVVHVITDLDVGGAEMLLYRVLAHTDSEVYSHEVISLSAEGALAPLIRDLNVPVRSLGLSRNVLAAVGVAKVTHHLRQAKASLVHTWMYHADLIGGLGARLAGVPAVVWALHAAPDPRRERLGITTTIGLRAAALASRVVPSKIVCCSFETQRVHERLGYARDKLVVIQNGFEPGVRAEGAAASVRLELGLPEDALLIGRIGRDHPQKDNRSLLSAFRQVVEAESSARLIMVGDGMRPTNEALTDQVQQVGLTASQVLLLGPRQDVTRLQSAFDVAVSSSYSEGLPVVIGEAMSVATPVVTTDAGDSRLLVDDPARIVPVRDPSALADALLRVVRMDATERRAIGERDRTRIRESFGFDGMLSAYKELYLRLLTEPS